MHHKARNRCTAKLCMAKSIFLSLCLQADPHHGERWAKLLKDPKNAHQPFEAVMALLVRDLATRSDTDL
jgi:hypothetical protein